MGNLKIEPSVFWRVLEVVIVGAFAVGIYYSIINGMEVRVCTLEKTTQENCLKVNSLETDIKWIKDGVSRIERRLEKR
jgi:hypothetical protein